MRQRTQGALVLVMTLVLFAASSQAAVCELSCALRMQTGACGMASGMAMPGNAAAMDMAAADCPAMHGAVADSRTSGGSCSHLLVLAVEKSGCVDGGLLAPQWTVVDALPVGVSLTVRERMAGKAPPLRLAAVDRNLISFRV